MERPTNTLALTLGAFAAGYPASDLPALALERARMSLASTLASASMGVEIESTAALRRMERALAGRSDAGSALWFAHGRLPPDRAARVNAVASDAAASDDSDLRSIAHIGTIISATGLAMAEARGSSGRDLLAAMVLGYEIAGRIDEALTPGRMQRGFHGSVSTIFSAATVAGRLAGLDGARMAQAYALAASSACGMAIAADTSCAREYHAGLAAVLGVQAALAAEAGFEGELTVLEAPRGFFAAMNGQAVDEVSRDLGNTWDIVTDMALKLMPGAHPFHAIAEAAATAAIEHNLDPARVRGVVVRAPQLEVWRKQAVQPTDLVSAAHSIAYVVAAAIVDREFGWDHFTEAKMRDARIAALTGRVELERDSPPHPDRFPHRHGGTVLITLDDERTITHTCTAPRGSGPRGIEWADVDFKYRRLAPAAGWTAEQVEQSLALVKDLERAPSVAPLVALLQAGRLTERVA
jgi:2-methylcitrate dehydratase PrpD